MMPKIFTINFFNLAFLMQACSGTHDKNMSKLDELHGECDNPANSAIYKKGSKNGRGAKRKKDQRVKDFLT